MYQTDGHQTLWMLYGINADRLYNSSIFILSYVKFPADQNHIIFENLKMIFRYMQSMIWHMQPLFPESLPEYSYTAYSLRYRHFAGFA